METMKVLLADDHALFRRGMSHMMQIRPEIEIVGEASDGIEAMEKARELMPDIILLDIDMPRLNGLDATMLIKEELPYVKIIILTVSEDERDLFTAIKNGAQGYLLKNLEPSELFEMLAGAVRGEAAITRGMAAKILNEFGRQASKEQGSPAKSHGLTQREVEVLQLVAKGASNREIANRLAIAENTVKNHLRNILDKLHLDNRVQAATYAFREGLVKRSDSALDEQFDA